MSGRRRALSANARKARLLRAYLTGGPLHCTWQLSPRCESFCHLCEHRSESAAEELDATGCARVAEALGADGSLVVTFTGSEPFLRADLPEIIAAVARRHFPLLVSNGWLVGEAPARAAWKAGLELASVAIEDASAERHDELTGMPGSHARAVAGLATLAASRTRRGQRVNVRTRLRGGETRRQLEALLALGAAHGATVTFEAAFPLPRLEGEGEGDRLARELRALKRRHAHLRSPAGVLDGIAGALRSGVAGCLSGRAFFNVDHRGRVSRCLEFRQAGDLVGSLAEQPLHTLRPQLRAAAAGHDCSACYYASRAEVESLFSVRGFLGGLRTLVGA